VKQNDKAVKEMHKPEKWLKRAKRENSAFGRDAMHRVCMFRRKKFFLKKGGEGESD